MALLDNHKLSNWWRGEVAGIRAALTDDKPPKRGLSTYPVMRADGKQKRLHLRQETDGSAILFVDVSDVIHLNPLAARVVRMALEGVSEHAARSITQSYFSENFDPIEEIRRIYTVVQHLIEHDEGCHTCALTGLVEQAPLFSIPTSAPYKIDIALTYGCNNQCPHCYNESGRLAMPSLPLEHWYRVFDKVADLGIPHVILTGGEATLHPDFAEIVRYADQLGMIVGLNSNGRFLGHRPFVEAIGAAGLNHIQVTLGSSDPAVHDAVMGTTSFHQTVKGIQTALDVGIHTITNTTLMRTNMDHVEEIINFLYDLGVRTFAMNGVIHSGGGFVNPLAIHTHELPALIAQVRDLASEKGMRFMWYTPTEYCRLSPVALDVGSKKCNAGEYSICIEPNGDVIPCQSYYVAAGNILNDRWKDIWDSDLFTSFRDREDAPEIHGLPEKCRGCPDLLVCGAGCRIEREAESGIRVAENSGGGCVGCSGYHLPGVEVADLHQHIPFTATEGGFIPWDSLVRNDVRSSGVAQNLTDGLDQQDG